MTSRRLPAVAFAFLLCTLALLPWGAPAGAEEAREEKLARDVREVVKKLQARYEQTRDLEASFEQTTKIEGFATPITSSGRVYVKKPGRLRWDYLEPNVEEIYVDRNDVLIYVPEHKQVLVGKLTQMAASQAPLRLLQGAAKLEEHFDVHPDPSGARGEGGLPRLALHAKGLAEPGGEKTVEWIGVEVYPKTHFIKTVAIHEVSGNVSTFRFTNIKANVGLKPGLFEFTVPEGVAVVKAPMLSQP